jgi:4-hydroxy-tetrahydrodipicolinate synthase
MAAVPAHLLVARPPAVSARRHSTFVISLTPFTEDGALDQGALRAHLQRLRASGIGVYLAGSGSGEGYTLTRDERRRVLEVGAEVLAGAVPVRAMGVEPRTAAEVVELAEDAVAAGVEATQVYSLDLGHGYVPTAEEQRAYLRAVLDHAPGDLVLSTHQSVGYHYEPALVAELLGEYPRVVGVNVTHRDLVYVAEVVDAIDGRVDVHVGGPMHALGAISLGATGYLSSEGNLAPRLCVALVECIDRDDREAAARVHGAVIAIHEATQALGGIVGAKAALRLLGAPGGWPRPPRLPVAPERAQVLVDVLDRLGVATDEGLR